METNKALAKYEEGEDVDVHLYRSMIGSLMYLTSSRPDIMFSVCACSRFQVQPKVSHMFAVKRIFRYLKGQPKLGLWYPKDSPFVLEALLDSDYAGASLDRKSTTRDCQFISSNGKAVVVSESSVRRDLHLNDEDGTACLTVNEIFENLSLMGYETASEKLTFYKGRVTQLFQNMLAPPVVVGEGSEQPTEPQPTSSTAPQEIITQLFTALSHHNHQKTQTYIGERKEVGTPRSERVLEQPIEPPLSEGHTSGNGEGRMEHQFELMANVPISPHDSLSREVLDLEKEKDAQAMEILRLKKRVKRLERQRKSSTSQPRRRKYRQVESSNDDEMDEEDASKQGRKNDKTNPMLHESDLMIDDETVGCCYYWSCTASAPVPTGGVAINTVEPRTPPTTTTLSPLPSINPKDKGKELAHKLHEEELAEIERIQKEKAAQEEVSMAAIYEEYDTIPDALFAAKLQQEDREQYTIKERAKFLAETIAAQRKFKSYSKGCRDQKEHKFIHDFVPMDSKKEEKKSMEPESEGKKKCYKRRSSRDEKEKEELRADGSLSYHEDMQAFLRRLDRQDLNDLYRVHTLFMDGTPMEINMLVEKKYLLVKELLEKMLNLQLEAEEESTMAFKLIKFIKSMLEE
ncbi:hypothetical protein Tco_1226692 [Tanacetum coccineum]